MSTYERPGGSGGVLPVDDQLDYPTGHYRHLNRISYSHPPRFRHGPIERRPAELQAADHARTHTRAKEEGK